MKFITILLFTTLISVSFADMPVHCLKSQTAGQWIIKYSKLTKTFSTCGHSTPSSEKQAYTVQSPEPLELEEEVTLNKDITVSGQDEFNEFNWTMVYDQGFALYKNLGKQNSSILLSYWNYKPNDNSHPEIKTKHYSLCNSTVVGWGKINNQYFCWKMIRKGTKGDEVTGGEAENKNIVTAAGIRPNFLESTARTEFSSFSSMVESINSSNLGWEAKIYDVMKNRSVEEVRRLMGKSRIPSKPSNFTSFLERKTLTRLSTTKINKLIKKFYSSLKEKTERKKMSKRSTNEGLISN